MNRGYFSVLAPFGLEHVVDEWLKVRQGCTYVISVERWRVVLGAELFGVFEVLITAEFFASILVEADVIPEVVALENPVVLHHPPVGF